MGLDHPPCSQNAHDQNVLVRLRAIGESTEPPVLGNEGLRSFGGEGGQMVQSRLVLAGRALMLKVLCQGQHPPSGYSGC